MLASSAPASFMTAVLYTSSRAASSSVAMSAIMKLMPWKLEMVRPNCLRVLA